MTSSVLVLDIGNTSTTAGVVKGNEVSDVRRYPRRQGAETNVQLAIAAYRGTGVSGVALASVVPSLSELWLGGVSQSLEVEGWELRTTDPQPLKMDVPRPETVGPDRLANAIAAVNRVGSPVMVADFGTALTFDVAVPERGYIGGVIAPGIDLMYSYFNEKTALLPELSFKAGVNAVGNTTEDAMHAGAFHGYRGMVRELSTRIREELGLEIPLLATGGYAPDVLKDFEEPVEVIPYLTLEGIAQAWSYEKAVKV
jgi:type III pantothenate kinase